MVGYVILMSNILVFQLVVVQIPDKLSYVTRSDKMRPLCDIFQLQNFAFSNDYFRILKWCGIQKYESEKNKHILYISLY